MNTHWKPTLTFTRFRRKHYELNRLYWTQYLGYKALNTALQHLPDSELTITHIAPELPQKQHLHTVAETREWAEEYLSRSRLHLLVICSANLESYLQEITFWHIANLGHLKTGVYQLTSVGKALGNPILGKASLPQPLKYAQDLFQLSFGNDLTVWQRSYKLRCAAAHNGGIVTARTLRDIPDLDDGINAPIGIDWPTFKTSLAAAENIAKTIDQKVSNKKLRILEVRRELEELKEISQLPDLSNLWSYIHHSFGLKGLTNAEKREIEASIYK
ncbi:MAG: hypothetical protein KDC54_25110 [Lewinella sp.]|nr:hypothetical protein [Lewinella sp.]